MAGDADKPVIPAWQRVQQTPPTQQSTPDIAQAPTATIETPKAENQQAAAPGAQDSTTASTEPTTPEQVKAFLADPEVKDAPLEKKRAFLESKGIPQHLIDQALTQSEPSFDASDFAIFAVQQKEQPQQAQSTPKATGPPIITYPEFLLSAHTTPPLITPARVLGATYFASAVAALLYGANAFLVSPMVNELTEARHDFAKHNLGKMEKFNDRLTDLVSKVPYPSPKPEVQLRGEEDEELEGSETSDPTELFHRDMGTQTADLPSSQDLEASQPALGTTESPPGRKDATKHQVDVLAILKSHLAELEEGVEAQEQGNKERMESGNKLRHYLDKLLYSNAGVNMWTHGDDGFSKPASGNGGAGGDDAIEELKKDIRSVKGVLLSARRFPTAAATAGGKVGT